MRRGKERTTALVSTVGCASLFAPKWAPTVFQRSVLYALVLLLVLVPVHAWGQDGPIELDPVQVTVARPDFLDSVTPATVIEVSDDEAQAGRTVADLLERVPGLQIVRTGSAGQRQSVSMRGADGRQVVVLLEGFDVADPGSGTADLSALPLSAVSRVEVYRGSRGAAAGNAAVGGAVVIRLRSGRGTEVLERLTSTAYGATSPAGAEALLQARHKALLLAYNHRFDQGDFSFVDTNRATRTRENNRSVSDRLTFSYRPRINRTARLELLGNMALADRGVPGIEQFPGLLAHEQSQMWLTGARLRVRRWPTTDWRWLAESSYGLWQGTFVDPESVLGVPVDTARTNQRAHLGLGATWDPRRTVGVDVRLRLTGEWMRTRLTEGTVLRRERPWGEGDVALRGTLPGAGVSGAASVRAAFLEDGSMVPIPALELAWQAARPVRLFASAARAWRLPSFDELYFESRGIRGNPELAPESSLSVEVGAALAWDFLTVEVSGFRQWVDELILFMQTTPYLIEAQNTGGVDGWGVEVDVSGHLGPVRVGGSFAWLESTFVESGNRLPLKSRYTATLDGRYRWRLLEVYAQARYRSAFTLDRYESRQEEGRVFLDAGVAADLPAGFRLAVDARNLLNKQGALDTFQYPLPGLSWYVTLEHRWQPGEDE